MRNIICSSLTLMFVSLFVACTEKPVELVKDESVEVITGAAENVKETSALLNGVAVLGKDVRDAEAGFLLGTSSSLTDAMEIPAKLNDKEFSSQAENLSEGTRYYYSAFVKVADEMTTGTVKSFLTSAFPVEVIAEGWLSDQSVRFNGKADLEELGDSDFGILISESDNPSSSNSIEVLIKTLDKDNQFIVDVDGLTGDAYYHYVGFYKRGSVYRIGEVKSIVARVVDLGLSVKWGSSNLGASTPEEYGDYFAWGETETKDSYTEDNYKFTSNPSVLPLANDVANVKLGGKWRMPTEADFEELINNCTSEWTTLKGVTGRKFVSKKNGNSIFLPAAGYRYGTSLDYAGSDGDYWSSSLSTRTDLAWRLFFGSGDVYTSSGSRYYGQSVRPVSEF